MSMFFFRFHNLRRAEEKRMKRRAKRNTNSDNLTAPSRLLERPLSQPVDSLDEIAAQIPRSGPFAIVALRLSGTPV
ncbi:unnamed protein product [Colias eurytheme]|nr:unnamed protein product [Colias eurytheme]